MLQQYNVKASYRHRFDPETGEIGPLSVWSPEALKDRAEGDAPANPSQQVVPDKGDESDKEASR